jgi:macrolide transport system ATP-binding/permease protein
MEIIGLVDDVKEGPLDVPARAAMYLPLRQQPTSYFSVVVRTSLAERSVLHSLATTVHPIDPGLAIYAETSMMDRIHDSPAAYMHRSSAWLVGGFASVALLLGVVGLYGVISYSVSQRAREIGVRIALGAPRGSVYQLILKEAGWLTAAGIGAGLVCAVVAATLMRGLLFGVASWDLPTLGLVSVVLGICALCAAYVPARRAASLDPVEVLRAE